MQGNKAEEQVGSVHKIQRGQIWDMEVEQELGLEISRGWNKGTNTVNYETGLMLT